MAMLIPGGGEVGEQGAGDRHRPHVSFTSGSCHFIGGSHLITKCVSDVGIPFNHPPPPDLFSCLHLYFSKTFIYELTFKDASALRDM